MAMLSRDALEAMGFAALGDNVLISDRASIYGAARIRLGGKVRIDDFCILSAGYGGITVGRYVHIAAYSSLIGAGAIQLEDFANLSSRVSVYSSSDDYSGRTMTNPTVPPEFKNVIHAPVRIGRHAIVGCGAILLPGADLGEGVAIGALSLVRGSCAPFGIYAGVPATRRAERRRDLLDLERQLLDHPPAP